MTRRLVPALVILLAAASARAAVGPGDLPPAAVDAARHARHLPLAERIRAVSATWLGVRYLLDPAGEGAAPDADPPGRYDAFDCLTFVEEVLALALAPDPVEAGRIRRALRYGAAPVAYEHRRHFMELQWLAGAVAEGWLRDTTSSYGRTVRLEREVDAAAWARWSDRGRFPLPDEALPVGKMALDVLPLAEARRVAPTLRPGSVLAVVREDRPDVPLWVSHLGFVVGGDRPTFRHASRGAALRVRDHDLDAYLQQQAGVRSWKVLGVAVFEPLDQGPPRRAPEPRLSEADLPDR